jgi:murein DD-endopeptidase MepM/ murein hydrolase activator NlpD
MAKETREFAEYIRNNNIAGVNTTLGSYDSSADYWKLLADGSLLNDNSGWLTNADGTFVQNADGNRIGANGIETGLLNILFGGTSNLAYGNFTDEQIQQAQALMIMAGMKYQEGADGTIKSRTWNGNARGTALDMNSVMANVGLTIAAPVFAKYFNSNVDKVLSFIFRKDIGEVNMTPVPKNAFNRYGSLVYSKLLFYCSAGSFVDLSKGYYISLIFGEEYDGYYASYNYKHYGFDLSREGGPSGDSLFAGISGIVSKANWNYEANGNDIQIEYGYRFENSFIGSGIYGEYLHMKNAPSFSIGTFINANTQIGQIAGTPNYAPHLHYDILTQNGNYSRTTLAMLLGKNAQANSFTSANGINRVYNPILYYNNFLGKDLYTKDEYMAMKNK